jgi:subtilisin family serine protease
LKLSPPFGFSHPKLEERKMPTKDPGNSKPTNGNASRTSSSVDEMLLAALERGADSLETGRYLITFKEGAATEGSQSLEAGGMRVADARDFNDQDVVLEAVGDADAVVFPEIGVALVGGDVAQERGLSAQVAEATDSPVESIDPELFVFSDVSPGQYLQRVSTQTDNSPNEYLRGFLRASELIANDLRLAPAIQPGLTEEEEIMALGVTWGLNACRVPLSARSGAGIKVAVLDTGLDVGHPDFAGRSIVSAQFVGQPVQDLHSHGTHCIGTACGMKTPSGTTPRYGIAFRSSIFVGKVLSNSGSSVSGSVLSGMNWAIANRCAVISMSLGSQAGPQPYYTAAGQAALNNGLLIIAAAGNNFGLPTGAPANSPTIMAVASLDSNLSPSAFSNIGKIEIAAPGRDVFSSVPRPTRYGVKSGTSMATPHVAGCAALWAESSTALRGMNLWNRLRSAAKPLPFSASRVGAGLVQAP